MCWHLIYAQPKNQFILDRKTGFGRIVEIINTRIFPCRWRSLLLCYFYQLYKHFIWESWIIYRFNCQYNKDLREKKLDFKTGLLIFYPCWMDSKNLSYYQLSFAFFKIFWEAKSLALGLIFCCALIFLFLVLFKVILPQLIFDAKYFLQNALMYITLPAEKAEADVSLTSEFSLWRPVK